MARNNYRKVSIRVHESWFNNTFEPERKKLSSILGINLSQPAFTHYLAKSGAVITYPKIKKMPRQNIKRNKFAPKKIDFGFEGNPFSML